MEKWKPITEYENSYHISDLGKVKSFLGKENRILKIRFIKGYGFVKLYKNNKAKNFSIHRLVAKHFIPNPENKTDVNHKDGNKLNNIISNLEWATESENINHCINELNKIRKFKKLVIFCKETGKIVSEYDLSKFHFQKIKF